MPSAFPGVLYTQDVALVSTRVVWVWSVLFAVQVCGLLAWVILLKMSTT